MKKLFALVLSLALVVAFAVPALASGWAQIDANLPYFKDVTLSLTALSIDQNKTALGTLYLPISETYPVARNSRIHFVVEFTIPSYTDPAVALLMKDKGLKLLVETTNITLDNNYDCYENRVKKGTSIWGKLYYDNTVFEDVTVAKPAATTTFAYDMWGTVDKDGEAKVVAKLGFYNKFDKNGVMGICVDADGKDEYTVYWQDAASYNGYQGFKIVDEYNQAIFFPTKGTDDKNQKVDPNKGILVSLNNKDWYVVGRSVIDRTWTFYALGAPNNALLDPTTYTYKELCDLADAMFKFLGFDYVEANYMTKAHFELYKGKIVELEKSISYGAGSVVVAPVSPELPQTGDNASIVGFAMIAVALVAAAVVTVKKVRA